MIVILYRSFKRSHSSSVFSQLTSLVNQFRTRINNGSFDQYPAAASVPPSNQIPESQQTVDASAMPQLYMLRVISDFVEIKVAGVMKGRKYNILLVFSFLRALAITTLVFCFENWALYRIDPSSFEGVSRYPFFEFLAYSLGQITTAGITTIRPISIVATLYATLAVICGVLILVILAFSFLTAARDTYREDLDEFSQAIHNATSAIDERLDFLYQLTAEELEITLAKHSAVIVNFFRRIRGLEELQDTNTNETSG